MKKILSILFLLCTPFVIFSESSELPEEDLYESEFEYFDDEDNDSLPRPITEEEFTIFYKSISDEEKALIENFKKLVEEKIHEGLSVKEADDFFALLSRHGLFPSFLFIVLRYIVFVQFSRHCPFSWRVFV